MQAMMAMIKKNCYKLYFILSEEELVAMSVQLKKKKKMHAMVNERQIYRADGVVRLGVTEDLEVGILKTAEPFKSDKSKVASDNSRDTCLVGNAQDHRRHVQVRIH